CLGRSALLRRRLKRSPVPRSAQWERSEVSCVSDRVAGTTGRDTACWLQIRAANLWFREATIDITRSLVTRARRSCQPVESGSGLDRLWSKPDDRGSERDPRCGGRKVFRDSEIGRRARARSQTQRDRHAYCRSGQRRIKVRDLRGSSEGGARLAFGGGI